MRIMKTKWADHVASIEEIKTAQKILEDIEISDRKILSCNLRIWIRMD